MTDYAVANTEKGTYHKQLAANATDVVTVEGHRDGQLEVWSDGTAAIYFTVDGTVPVVEGQDTYEVPAGGAAARTVPIQPGANTVVTLISVGTPHYSVTAGV